MSAMVFRVGKPPEVVELQNGFSGIQLLVGDGEPATITSVCLDQNSGRKILLWNDEDGLLKSLKANLWAQGPLYRGTAIFGTAVLVAARIISSDYQFLKLRSDEISDWSRMLIRAKGAA